MAATNDDHVEFFGIKHGVGASGAGAVSPGQNTNFTGATLFVPARGTHASYSPGLWCNRRMKPSAPASDRATEENRMRYKFDSK